MTAPLRRNPFLCHWVEVVQRWEKKLDDARAEKLREASQAPASYWWIFAYGARLGIVKAFLMEDFPQVSVVQFTCHIQLLLQPMPHITASFIVMHRQPVQTEFLQTQSYRHGKRAPQSMAHTP